MRCDCMTRSLRHIPILGLLGRNTPRGDNTRIGMGMSLVTPEIANPRIQFRSERPNAARERKPVPTTTNATKKSFFTC